MLDVNVAVEVDDDILEEMVVNPGAQYVLKLVQRDRTYDGTPNPAPADHVWKVTLKEK